MYIIITFMSSFTLTKFVFKIKNILIKYWPIIIFAILPFLILGPALGRGYILQYDMIFSPHVNINFDNILHGNALVQSLPRLFLFKFFSLFTPLDIVQKNILYYIFFLSALIIYLVLPVKSKLARFSGALFYTLNPFTYDRLMAGHWLFLLGYALTPLAVWCFYKLFTSKEAIYFWLSIFIWSFVAIISPHHLLIAGLLFICFCAIYIRNIRLLIWASLVVVGVIFFSLWWLLPTLLIANFTQTIGINQFYAFATQGDPVYGLWFNMLSLQGFWYTNWLSLKSFFSFWPILIILWLSPIFIGLGSLKFYNKTKLKFALAVTIAAIIAILLAAGPSSAAIWQINSWIFLHIPGMDGLRESQKWLSVVALCYSTLVAYGINMLAAKKYNKSAIVLSVFSTVMVILVAWPIFWGAHGQMKAIQYPSSWQKAYQYLSQNNSQKVLILPWTLYINNSFAGHLVANPAKVYFDNTISSQDMNLPTVIDVANNENSQLKEALIQKNPELINNLAKQYDIGYIIIVPSDTSNDYNWVKDIQGSKTIFIDNNLQLIVLTNT